MQRLIRAYKDETGERELDMHKVAKWAVGKGWTLPRPPDRWKFLLVNLRQQHAKSSNTTRLLESLTGFITP